MYQSVLHLGISWLFFLAVKILWANSFLPWVYHGWAVMAMRLQSRLQSGASVSSPLSQTCQLGRACQHGSSLCWVNICGWREIQAPPDSTSSSLFCRKGSPCPVDLSLAWLIRGTSAVSRATPGLWDWLSLCFLPLTKVFQVSLKTQSSLYLLQSPAQSPPSPECRLPSPDPRNV